MADDGQTVVAIIDDDQATLKSCIMKMEDLDYSQQIRLSCRFIEKKGNWGCRKIIRNIESNKEGNLVPKQILKKLFQKKIPILI